VRVDQSIKVGEGTIATTSSGWRVETQRRGWLVLYMLYGMHARRSLDGYGPGIGCELGKKEASD